LVLNTVELDVFDLLLRSVIGAPNGNGDGRNAMKGLRQGLWLRDVTNVDSLAWVAFCAVEDPLGLGFIYTRPLTCTRESAFRSL